jgi:hypothetical protein
MDRKGATKLDRFFGNTMASSGIAGTGAYHSSDKNHAHISLALGPETINSDSIAGESGEQSKYLKTQQTLYKDLPNHFETEI